MQKLLHIILAEISWEW